jgi:LPS sulfotransferase NodH
MKPLISVIINDIVVPPLLTLTQAQLGIFGEVAVISSADFTEYGELETKIKSLAIDYMYVLVIRLGDTISPELQAFIPEFLENSLHELKVNYVTEYGFNSEPLKWAKRILISRADQFHYDGLQIVPNSDAQIEETEFEMYYNIGINLREYRLRNYNHTNLLISSQVQLFDEWFSIRLYAKAEEIGHAILRKSANIEVRNYILNQLSSLAMLDQNQDKMSDIIEQYAEDLPHNILVLADYYFAFSEYKEVLDLLSQYEEPIENNSGVPYDRERYLAYVYLLKAKSLLYLKQTEEAIEVATEFYTHSVVLRNQINWVKLLTTELHNQEEIQSLPKPTNTTPPNFLLLSQPRTGSTYVQQLLDSHSSLDCFGELLAVNKPRFGLHNSSQDLSQLIQQRIQNPVAFLSDQMSDSKAMVGFKLLIFQLEQYEEKQRNTIWQWLLDNGNTKVIYLKRRDVIATYISFLLASNNHYWQTTKGSGKVFDTVTVNLVHFKTYLEKMRDWEIEYVSQILPSSLLTMYYEDILQNGMGEIEKYLELREEELSAQTLRQGTIPLEYLVPNLDKVREFYEENPIYI